MNETTPKRFLLLDDHGSRSKLFETQVSGNGLIVDTITEASELEQLKDDLEVLSGVIVDFHLNTSTNPEYPYLKYPCTAPDCPDVLEPPVKEHARHAALLTRPINITTGLGAMLYIKQHAPRVTLYGFCELTADHSWMFLTAAGLWLGAYAINANYPPDQLRKALLSDTPEDHLPVNDQLQRAEPGFELLMDSLDFLDIPAEAFDWLGEYRFCPKVGTRAEFARRLQFRFPDRSTLDTRLYMKIMRRWQRALAQYVQPFNVDVSTWPDLRDADSVKHWDKHNPILDFVRNGHLETFFTAPDVRAALTYHRDETRRLAEEDDNAYR